MRRACVIGWPIGHSRSPLIHNHWLALHGIDGTYEKQAVAPGALARFLATMADAGYAGCNVTLPHKRAVFGAVHIGDDATTAIGAVNTVYFDNGTLTGTSTDGYGFLASLTGQTGGWQADGRACVVLGAGGAARAIVAALAGAGAARITIINRTLARAGQLAAAFGPVARAAPLSTTAEALATADLLVNTTSLGMTGQPPLVIDLAPLARTAPVCDIVYAPLETPLLASARSAGHPVVDGLGMLLHQAVPGFEKWFGQRPQVTPELRALVVADLAGAGA